MSDRAYSVFNAMTDIVSSPGKALDEVKQHTAWLWWPLLASMALAAGMLIYYYNWVDFAWLVEETIRQQPIESRAESADGIRKFMTPEGTMWMTLVGVVVMTVLIYTIQSTYFHLVNKLTTGAEIGFGQWFSFSTWTGFVAVFGSVAAFVVIFTADTNQLPAENLQVLSLNSLLVHASVGEPWFRWANSLSLINFWMLYLASMGYARWTGASMVKSTVIAVFPWALVFGIWALLV